MYLIELIVIALGLSTDAFAVSVSAGLTMGKVNVKKALVIGLYFGIFQAAMPVVGYLLAVRFSHRLVAFSPWIAFILLSFLGIKALVGALRKDPEAVNHDGGAEVSVGPKKMLPLAIATSIDALAVGVTFAFMYVRIVFAVSLIGIVTFVVSVAGVKIGNVFGARFKTKAEIFGGIMLIGVGLFILVEHLLY